MTLRSATSDSANSEILVGGVPVTPFPSIDGALSHILPELGVVRAGFAVAINAEKIVRAKTDPSFLAQLANATLRYADGAPVSWAIARKGIPNARVPGVELWESLLTRAGREDIPVFVLGASPEVNSATRKKLVDELGVNVVDAHHGYFDDEAAIIARIADSRAAIVCVAMGSPKQEQFIRRCRAVHPNAFYMGVGGSYDVYVGRVKRAPTWMGDMGLEWLYRLARQPSRIWRQRVLVRYLWWFLRGEL